jgi:ribose transport system substrate-binding protein
MLRSDSRAYRWPAALLLLLAVGVLAAGCGSSDSSSSSSAAEAGTTAETGETDTAAETEGGEAGGAASGGLAEAEELAAKYEAQPKSIGITEPVGKPIPEGKEIMFMMCGIPSCQAFVEPVEKAASVLGWKVNVVVAGPTPDKTTQAWNLAVRDKPDAVVSTGFPETMWSKQLAELKSAGVPVVECCTTDSPGNGVVFVDTNKDAGKLGGEYQAYWTVADSEGQANALYINIPAYPVLTAELEGFTEQFERLCPECTMETYDQNVADVGTPSGVEKIVGYLRSHPDINYLVAGADDSYVGLPAAIRAAGLSSGLKAIGLAPTTVNLNYIANEEVQAASISFPTAEIGWKMFDILARYFTKSSLKPDEQILPRRILTKEAIKDPDVIEPTTPTFEAEFEELWGK